MRSGGSAMANGRRRQCEVLLRGWVASPGYPPAAAARVWTRSLLSGQRDGGVAPPPGAPRGQVRSGGDERRLKGAVAVRAGSRGECGRLGGGRRVGAACGQGAARAEGRLVSSRAGTRGVGPASSERVRQGLLRLGRGCRVVPGASGAAVVVAASRPRAGAPEG